MTMPDRSMPVSTDSITLFPALSEAKKPPTRLSPAPFVSTISSFAIFGTSTNITVGSSYTHEPKTTITGNAP